jgi:hypothetical protein
MMLSNNSLISRSLCTQTHTIISHEEDLCRPGRSHNDREDEEVVAEEVTANDELMVSFGRQLPSEEMIMWASLMVLAEAPLLLASQDVGGDEEQEEEDQQQEERQQVEDQPHEESQQPHEEIQSQEEKQEEDLKDDEFQDIEDPKDGDLNVRYVDNDHSDDCVHSENINHVDDSLEQTYPCVFECTDEQEEDVVTEEVIVEEVNEDEEQEDQPHQETHQPHQEIQPQEEKKEEDLKDDEFQDIEDPKDGDLNVRYVDDDLSDDDLSDDCVDSQNINDVEIDIDNTDVGDSLKQTVSRECESSNGRKKEKEEEEFDESDYGEFVLRSEKVTLIEITKPFRITGARFQSSRKYESKTVFQSKGYLKIVTAPYEVIKRYKMDMDPEDLTPREGFETEIEDHDTEVEYLERFFPTGIVC